MAILAPPRFDGKGDMCLGFFATAWAAGVCPLPEGATVLEIGCDEADWQASMREARPDLVLYGIDWRSTPRLAADVRLVGDVLQQRFAPATFDAIVMVSVIEWIGIGHYGDPVVADADMAVMTLCHTWLKPGGWLYLDTPWSPQILPLDTDTERRPAGLRAYPDAALHARLYRDQWREVWREHFTGNGHPDGPYVAVVLRKA